MNFQMKTKKEVTSILSLQRGNSLFGSFFYDFYFGAPRQNNLPNPTST
jgi:hypothetical protein